MGIGQLSLYPSLLPQEFVYFSNTAGHIWGNSNKSRGFKVVKSELPS